MKKLLLLSALLIFACSDDEGNPCVYEPTLSTEAVTDITETSATLNGIIAIESDNCDVPNNTEQGFVYSTEIQPTLEDTQVNVNGTNISTTIEGLNPNTTYYVRSFLTNTLGNFYGNEVSFSTEELDLTPPVITIIGDNPLEINIGEDYTEFGATATDDIDGDISQDILIDSSNLNTALTGNYAVTYSVSDSSNNLTSEQREVIVINNATLYCNDNEVQTIVYGSQEWTVQDACHIIYRDGTIIPEVTDETEWANLTTGAWSYYDNDPSKPRVYNWYAVAGIHDNDPNTPNKEFAPEYWHVPTDDEWTTLENYISYNTNYTDPPLYTIGKAMASTSGWYSSINTGAVGNEQSLNNNSGFNGYPLGIRDVNGIFSLGGYSSIFWSSTLRSNNSTWERYLFYNDGFLDRGVTSSNHKAGFLVRLVKD
jgi:uncharacterized protein (TIGR02145 family)